MTNEAREHIVGICDRFARESTLKYYNGQAEHGGNLWQKPGAMANLRAEILDLVIYQDTLRQQLTDVLCLLEAGRFGEAGPALRAILGPTCD